MSVILPIVIFAYFIIMCWLLVVELGNDEHDFRSWGQRIDEASDQEFLNGLFNCFLCLIWPLGLVYCVTFPIFNVLGKATTRSVKIISKARAEAKANRALSQIQDTAGSLSVSQNDHGNLDLARDLVLAKWDKERK